MKRGLLFKFLITLFGNLLKKGLQTKGAVIKCFQERTRADQEFEPKAQGLRSAANVCRAGLEEQRGGSIHYQ